MDWPHRLKSWPLIVRLRSAGTSRKSSQLICFVVFRPSIIRVSTDEIGEAMMTDSRFDRYRRLSAPFGEQTARVLIDKLQVLALTQPETLREIESFIDRGLLPARRFPVYPNPDR